MRRGFLALHLRECNTTGPSRSWRQLMQDPAFSHKPKLITTVPRIRCERWPKLRRSLCPTPRCERPGAFRAQDMEG